MPLNATTVNNQDIWLKNAPRSKLQKNATVVKKPDTSQETVPREKRELQLNATNVMRPDIWPETVAVII